MRLIFGQFQHRPLVAKGQHGVGQRFRAAIDDLAGDRDGICQLKGKVQRRVGVAERDVRRLRFIVRFAYRHEIFPGREQGGVPIGIVVARHGNPGGRRCGDLSRPAPQGDDGHVGVGEHGPRNPGRQDFDAMKQLQFRDGAQLAAGHHDALLFAFVARLIRTHVILAGLDVRKKILPVGIGGDAFERFARIFLPQAGFGQEDFDIRGGAAGHVSDLACNRAERQGDGNILMIAFGYRDGLGKFDFLGVAADAVGNLHLIFIPGQQVERRVSEALDGFHRFPGVKNGNLQILGDRLIYGIALRIRHIHRQFPQANNFPRLFLIFHRNFLLRADFLALIGHIQHIRPFLQADQFQRRAFDRRIFHFLAHVRQFAVLSL